MLNPILRSDTPAKVDRYQGEPYVVAADISNQAGARRDEAGWTWYTGSAGWMYRLGIEAILGLRRRGDALQFEPCIPKAWPSYRIDYRFGRSLYSIEVHNPDGVSRGVREVMLDGGIRRGWPIPLVDDAATHAVRIRMG